MNIEEKILIMSLLGILSAPFIVLGAAGFCAWISRERKEKSGGDS